MVTIRFFESKVFTVIFLCLLTNFSMPKASAATATTGEYDGSDGGSEWIANHRYRYGHAGDTRYINTQQYHEDIALYYRLDLRTGERVLDGELHHRDSVTLATDHYSTELWVAIRHPNKRNATETVYIERKYLVREDPARYTQSPRRTAPQLAYYQIPARNYRIKQGRSTYLLRNNTWDNQWVTRYGERIRLGQGREVTVKDGIIYRSAAFGRGIIGRDQDPIEDGWLKVKVQFPEGVYEGYIEYKYLDIPYSGNRVSLNSAGNGLSYYCFNNVNREGNSLPIVSDNWGKIGDLWVNQAVLTTGRIKEGDFYRRPYEWSEINITDGFRRVLFTGWVPNRPLYGPDRTRENLTLCNY